MGGTEQVYMEPPQKRRPLSVTIVGTLFLAIAIVMVLSSLWGLLTFDLFRPMGQEMLYLSEDAPWGTTFVLIIARHYDVVFLLELVFAIVVLIVSIQFLSLRAWARTALEIMCWIFLGIGIVSVVGLWVHVGLVPLYGRGTSAYTRWLVLGLLGICGVIVLVMYIVPLVVLIYVLRTRTVRDAVS